MPERRERDETFLPVRVDSIMEGSPFPKYDDGCPYTHSRRVVVVANLDEATGDVVYINRKKALGVGIHLQDWRAISVGEANQKYDNAKTPQTVDNFRKNRSQSHRYIDTEAEFQRRGAIKNYRIPKPVHSFAFHK